MGHVSYILAALAFTVVLGLFVLALAPSALAQSSDADDALALYDENDNGIIDADEAIAAVLDYLNDRISRDLAVRVMRMYLDAHPTGQSEQSGDFPCALYDQDCDGQTAKYEVINAINDYLFGDPPPIRKDHVISIINCYLFDEDDDPDFLPVAPPVPKDLTGRVGPGVGQISLDWDSVDRANGYKVQQKYGQSWNTLTATSTPHRVAIDVSQSNAVVSGLTNGISYEHRVSAVCSHGGGSESSEWSTSITTPPPPVPTPTVSISAVTTSVTEGQSITFTLTSSFAPSSNLPVNVDVTQSGSFIRGIATTSVTIRSGQTSASFSVDTDDDSVDEPSGSITARVETGTGYGVGSPSSKIVTVLDNDLPTLATPTDLDVEPLPLRKAKLIWAADANADEYVVEIRKFGQTSWTAQPATTQAYYEIDLDRILGGDGLADAPYEFHVKATKRGSSHHDSAYSDTITIIDTPIIAANGNSPGLHGQAKLSWRTMSNVLGASYLGGTYSFRARQADQGHTKLAWQPGTYVSVGTIDQTQMTGANRDTIGGLTKGEIYAIQLRYEKPGTSTSKVFAARDVYVWPSDRPAGGGERVATFPLNYPLSNKTYSYVVCEDTFPSGKGDEWKTFITHAFSQWDLATKNLVTTERVDGDCADYSEFVDEVIAAVTSFAMGNILPGPPPTASQIKAHATALLGQFNKSRIATTSMKDARLNEVLMIDDSSINVVTVDAFKEISIEVGHGWCPYACASFPTPPLNTVDIRFVGSHFNISNLTVPGTNDTADPGEIPFNSCDPVVEEYGVLVHEAGHALGITGGIDGSQYDNGQGQFHPRSTTIKDSVMSYGRNHSVSCSPYPLDVLAIYALYQDR